MSELKDELIEVTVIKSTGTGVDLKCTIKKSVIMSLFGGYDFNRRVEEEITKRLVKEMPLSMINEIRNKIDLDSVAKLATLNMAEMVAGRQR